MINHVTKGIRISVKTIYDGSYFKNYNLHFAFNYIIKITNQSKSTVQLKSRHWRIFDSLSSDIIIDGEEIPPMKTRLDVLQEAKHGIELAQLP